VPQSEHLGKILIEDYNGDGRPDIFIADSGIDGAPFTGRQNKLILSTPACKLVDASANLPQQSDFTHSATVGDVDNDGDVDIYVGNIWGANLIPPQIWLNDGAGHFVVASGLLPAAQTDFNLNRYTTSLLVDLNNDGSVDLVLGGDQFGDQNEVLLNDGTGHFTRVPNALPGRPWPDIVPLDVKSTDFDHDGVADIAIEYSKFDPYYQGRYIQLFRGNGDGTFVDQTASRLFPTQVDNLLTWLLFVHFVDLDGDGNNDLIGQLVGTNADNHRFYMASNTGVFTETSFLAGRLGDVFALVDSRGDGHRDVIDTRNIGNDQHTVSLIPDVGAVMPPGVPQRVRASRTIPGHVRLFWQYTWGATGYEVWRSAVAGSAGQLIATLNTTSFDDTTLSGTAYYSVKAVNSAGTSTASTQKIGDTVPGAVTPAVPTFTAPQLQFAYASPGRILNAATGDFNCDNRPDMIFSNTYYQGETGTLAMTVALSNGSGGYTNGTGTIFGGTPITQSEHPGKIVVDDFNGDGRADIFVAEQGYQVNGRQNRLILSAPNCTLVDATANLPQQIDNTASVSTGDVDNDGDADIFVGNVFSNAFIGPQIWLNDGTGHFTVAANALPPAQADLSQNHYTASLLVDVNNDGNIDLVLGGDSFANQNEVLLNDGAGHFSRVSNALPGRPFGQAVALDIQSTDLNHDGIMDLAIEYSKPPFYSGRWIQLFKGNGDGTFVDQTSTRLSPTQVDNSLTYILALHFVDIDGDQNHDLVAQLLGTSSDHHRFYLANNSGVFTETSILSGSLGDVFAFVDARGDGHRDVLDTRNLAGNNHSVSLISDAGPVHPPGVPQNMRPTRGLVGHVRLWWPYVWGATSYEVWRSAAPGTLGQLVGTSNSTSYDDVDFAGTGYYTIKAKNSSGTSGGSFQKIGTAIPNLVANGSFSNGTNGWIVYGNPTPGDIQWSVSNGVFQFSRGLTTNNTAAIFQETNVTLPSNSGVTAQFDIGNSSNVRRRISVLLIEKDFSDITVCTFWLAPQSPLRTYRMTTHSTKAWTLGAAVYFYAATQDVSGGSYLLANVSVKQDAQSLGGTRCFDPTAPVASGAPEGPGLLQNFDFGPNGGTTDYWSVFNNITYFMNGAFYFLRAPSALPAGGILQNSHVTVPAGSIVTAWFTLGNTSAVRKRATILLMDGDYSDLAACTFWIPPGLAPLQSSTNYLMRTFTTKTWVDATFALFAATVDNEQWSALDNVVMKVTPAMSTSGTDCAEPGGQVQSPSPLAVSFAPTDAGATAIDRWWRRAIAAAMRKP
jgi:hypothetical protein